MEFIVVAYFIILCILGVLRQGDVARIEQLENESRDLYQKVQLLDERLRAREKYEKPFEYLLNAKIDSEGRIVVDDGT
jgi:hypothetical protein